ncbi:hypothetical protein OK074_7609 [Actinobacteria bacterium OK074]|nr:hypothetical protein OK074_7609 [Actinobacteria bacterium OK074]
MPTALVPIELPEWAWQRADIREALRGRDRGAVFRHVQQYGGASQSRIATAVALTQARVNEVINGRREIARFDVFERIADGLSMPDDARHLLGLRFPCARPRSESPPNRLPGASSWPKLVCVSFRPPTRSWKPHTAPCTEGFSLGTTRMPYTPCSVDSATFRSSRSRSGAETTSSALTAAICSPRWSKSRKSTGPSWRSRPWFRRRRNSRRHLPMSDPSWRNSASMRTTSQRSCTRRLSKRGLRQVACEAVTNVFRHTATPPHRRAGRARPDPNACRSPAS